jgi:hypothetical protein
MKITYPHTNRIPNTYLLLHEIKMRDGAYYGTSKTSTRSGRGYLVWNLHIVILDGMVYQYSAYSSPRVNVPGLSKFTFERRFRDDYRLNALRKDSRAYNEINGDIVLTRPSLLYRLWVKLLPHRYPIYTETFHLGINEYNF